MAQTEENLTRNQKLALSGLAVFGVLIVVLWIFNLNNQIKGPLAYGNSSNNSQGTTQTEEQKLRNQDTDKDGVSDWDELYVYGTSPYLEDSDSDGIPDGTEIKNGTDPNCPQGQDCGTTAVTGGTSVSGATGNLNQASTSIILINSSSTPGSETELQGMLGGESDAATLRKLLLDAGMNKTDLDKISDEVLLGAYQDLIKQNTQ